VVVEFPGVGNLLAGLMGEGVVDDDDTVTAPAGVVRFLEERDLDVMASYTVHASDGEATLQADFNAEAQPCFPEAVQPFCGRMDEFAVGGTPIENIAKSPFGYVSSDFAAKSRCVNTSEEAALYSCSVAVASILPHVRHHRRKRRLSYFATYCLAVGISTPVCSSDNPRLRRRGLEDGFC